MKDQMLYDELSDALRDVRSTIAEWRADGVFDGDRGFQDLLGKESEIEERMTELSREDES